MIFDSRTYYRITDNNTFNIDTYDLSFAKELVSESDDMNLYVYKCTGLYDNDYLYDNRLTLVECQKKKIADRQNDSIYGKTEFNDSLIEM
jgi:hypothetical protein